jgi:hypothetical protein
VATTTCALDDSGVDVGTAKPKFWKLETTEEFRMVQTVLRRRVPETYEVLERSLERADPMEMGEPVEEGEYSDVIREVLVLLAPMNGNLAVLSAESVLELIREGLARCFHDPPDEERLRRTARLMAGQQN